MPPEHPEPPVKEVLEEHDRFGRWIAVAIVVTTLTGALVAFLQANSVFRHAEAASRAEQWATLAAGARTRSEKAERLQTAHVRIAREDRLRAEQATALRLLGGGDPLAQRLEARRWHRLAAMVGEGSRRIAEQVERELALVEQSGREAMPNVDPTEAATPDCERERSRARRALPMMVPGHGSAGGGDGGSARYVTDTRREGHRFDALRDGATHEAETAEKQFTRYAVSLAALAVAVFLFGYALTPFGLRHRRLYAVAAGCIALGAALWGVYSYVRGPETPPPAAAAAYGDGLTALEANDLRDAIDSLTCAVEEREEFPLAYLARSQAYNALGARQQEQTIFNENLVDPRFRRLAAEDAERAGETHAKQEEGAAIATLATEAYADALRHGDHAGLEHALDLHEDARELQPRLPLNSFNVGTTLLALGRPWRPAYRRALRLAGPEELAAYGPAALTDLHFLAGKLPEREAEVHAAKELVAAVISSSGPLPAAADMALRDVRLRVTPGVVEVAYTTSRPLGPRDLVFPALYRRVGGGWVALPTLSNAVWGGVGRRYYQVVSRGAETRCGAGGAYRVEVYVDGRLAPGAAARTDARFPALSHEPLEDLGVDVCRPVGWRPLTDRVPGVADGFGSPDGRAGIVVFDMSAAVAAGVRRSALVPLARSRFASMLPRRARLARGQRSTYVLGLAGKPTWLYRYPGGGAILGRATTPAGRTMVVAAYGPGATFSRLSSALTINTTDLFFAALSTDP